LFIQHLKCFFVVNFKDKINVTDILLSFQNKAAASSCRQYSRKNVVIFTRADLRSGLDQLAGLSVEAGPLQEQTVDVHSFRWRVVDILLGKPTQYQRFSLMPANSESSVTAQVYYKV
jgi:hypothetical protein